jgi:hypothetical protein
VAADDDDDDDDDDDGKLISWPVRIAIAVAVFSLGILVGAAVAAWVVPPI